ncbi:hypothetical protein Syun_011786 [Stephania yunnanensis]|uniref:Uncharacterized protein n=1 Tax=Stephania yunnanensis TaxID=152371 RepID=A0AAP0JY79_9MAGN
MEHDEEDESEYYLLGGPYGSTKNPYLASQSLCDSSLFLDRPLQDGEAYAYMLNTLAPNIPTVSTLDTKDPKKKGRTNYSKMQRN